MADATLRGDCVPVADLKDRPSDYPWWPTYAVYCGRFYNQNWYRPDPAWTAPPPSAPPPPAPPPPAPTETPAAGCVPIFDLQDRPQDYPWWPDFATYCGRFDNVNWYRQADTMPPPPQTTPIDDPEDSRDFDIYLGNLRTTFDKEIHRATGLLSDADISLLAHTFRLRANARRLREIVH